MTFEEFEKAVERKEKPQNLNPMLEAMYEDGIGNWDTAHNIAQDYPGEYGNLIHAYLHRKEGDNWNANYWYRNAGRKMPSCSLQKEWEDITREIINNN